MYSADISQVFSLKPLIGKTEIPDGGLQGTRLAL